MTNPVKGNVENGTHTGIESYQKVSVENAKSKTIIVLKERTMKYSRPILDCSMYAYIVLH